MMRRGWSFAANGFLKCDFTVSAEDDLSEEADHAGFFEREAALAILSSATMEFLSGVGGRYDLRQKW
jgi:hypothetical protein